MVKKKEKRNPRTPLVLSILSFIFIILFLVSFSAALNPPCPESGLLIFTLFCIPLFIFSLILNTISTLIRKKEKNLIRRKIESVLIIATWAVIAYFLILFFYRWLRWKFIL